MPKWTKEQLEAITKNGSNIIVSAGAGSGKTAVLTERVIKHLEKGIKINELLILTFTNAAAAEMKDRIRRKISERYDLLDNLDYLDSAYITTFDSFTLSLVKKYNYKLNVSSNINIVDNGVITLVKEELLNQVFDQLYEENNELFFNLLNDFTIKNDTSIKSAILKIIKGLELKINKNIYLNNYINDNFNKEIISNYIKDYENLILDEIKNIETNLFYISESDFYEYYDNLVKSLDKLIKAKTYDEILNSINVTLPRRPKDSDEIKEFKDEIDISIKNIKSYLRFESTEEILETFNITKKYVEIIIEIIKRYYIKLNEYKLANDLYEFTDIEIMAINLLKENEDIKAELKKYYYEICVDEYQDTNDLQEEFISLIENNNVYMVGDIKQSIYGFRNANPTIFKQKYDNYGKNNGGIKIDLLKNFRSREEVLNGINEIFSMIMDDFLGGANYQENHQMIFGNSMFDEYKVSDQNYDLEILNYNYENHDFTKEEIEAFIIGKDILNKVNTNYKVIDKSTNQLQSVKFDDFCIIMDRGTNFFTYNKIFEYLGIPLTIFEDKKLTSETDIMLINNIIGLILKIKDNIVDVEFKYYFMSIARSFLFKYNDDYIFDIISTNSFKDTSIYLIAENICKNIELLDNHELLLKIIDDFNYYENLIKVGNVEESIIRINNLLDISRNLSKSGYTIYDFKSYLNEMITSKNEISYKDGNINQSGVKIMNIHKSKGLEFPICYFSGYHKEFNTADVKDRFVFDNKYGIITPFYKEGIGSTILKDLLKNKYNIDNISERIRLLYVALTRAKEKMIIVTNLDELKLPINNKVDTNIRKKYTSFLKIMNSISKNLEKYIKNVNLSDLNITKDYVYGVLEREEVNNISKDNLIRYENIIIENDDIVENNASKHITKLISKDEYDALKYGTEMHKLFEQTNFLKIDENNENKNVIENFVKMLNITSDTLVYKEYEFIFDQENVTYHGIIDLILIDKDIIKVVDYKLKNIDDPGYVNQLSIYYNYLKTMFDKKIELYLYSIIDNKLKKVEVINDN